MRTRPPDAAIDAPPPEVANRLRGKLLTVRSVWFPTRAELRDWSHSASPLYVRWLGADRFEIGPRLASMWAACFSPVIRGSLAPEANGTRVHWDWHFPRFTVSLLTGWAVVLVIWALVLLNRVQDGLESPGLFGFWFLLAGGAVSSTAIGGRLGGRALDESLPWLIAVASEPPVDEDW